MSYKDKIFHHTPIADKTVLVTGGAGFVGSHIVEYLLAHNVKHVRVIDNFANGKRENVELFKHYPNFEFIEGDIRDADACMQWCKGVDMVCHQAALGSVPRSIKTPLATNSVNVDGYLNILVAAKDNGVKRIVYASSSSVYGDHPALPKIEENIGKQLSPYAVSKYTNELYQGVFADIYGMEIIGLRYFNIFGPRQDPFGPYAAVIPLFTLSMLKGEAPFINGDGKQTRDFTFVENAVQANIRALTTPNTEALGKVYNIAVGENFTVLEMFDVIAKSIGTDMTPQFRDTRAGDVRDSLADISKARTLFGYNPEVRFKEGVEKTVAYFKSIAIPAEQK